MADIRIGLHRGQQLPEFDGRLGFARFLSFRFPLEEPQAEVNGLSLSGQRHQRGAGQECDNSVHVQNPPGTSERASTDHDATLRALARTRELNRPVTSLLAEETAQSGFIRGRTTCTSCTTDTDIVLGIGIMLVYNIPPDQEKSSDQEREIVPSSSLTIARVFPSAEFPRRSDCSHKRPDKICYDQVLPVASRPA
jgi:hypothetical protein